MSEKHAQELAVPDTLARANLDAGKEIYSPLKDKGIRIVRLHRWESSADDPIRCSLLVTETRYSTYRYEALSYVWGVDSLWQWVTLSEKPYMVTENLWMALKFLRKRDADRLIWVDALAINQTDILERTCQVEQMREIYASAYETIIWLGPGFGRKTNLFQAIWKIKKENAKPGCKACLSQPFHHFDKLSEQWDSGQLDLLSELDEFCSFKYWERVWVVQEMLYSQKAMLYCGSDKLSMDIFRPFWHALGTTMKNMRNVVNRQWYYILTSKIVYQAILVGSEQEDRFFSYNTWVLHFCVKRKCSDPRDLVFGFYHCFSPEIRDMVRVDYSKSEHEVFRDVTRAFMENAKELSCFLHVERFSRLAKNVFYPSWTPIYFNKDRITPFRQNVTYPTDFYFEEDGSHLCVKGICIGIAQYRYSSLSPVALQSSFSFPGMDRNDLRLGKMIRAIRLGWIDLGIPWDQAHEYLVARKSYESLQHGLSPFPFENLNSFFTQLSTLTGNEIEGEIEESFGNEFIPISVVRRVWSTCYNQMDEAAVAYKLDETAKELGIPLPKNGAFNIAIGNTKIDPGDVVCFVRGYDFPIALRPEGDTFIFIGNVAIKGIETQHPFDQFHALDDSRLEIFRIR